MWARNKIRREEYNSILRDARDFALTNGNVLRFPNFKNDNIVGHIPFTLFPTIFPKQLYEECCDIQPIVSTLMFKIANDYDYMESNLKNIIQVDDFTKRLLEINKQVLKEGLAQSIISCINRSDYLLNKYTTSDDKSQIDIRQVEVNAIASGMSGHSYKVRKLHNYLMTKYQLQNFPPEFQRIPSNESLDLVAQGMIDAFNAYDKHDSYILVVIEDRSINFSDHFMIELKIQELRPDIRLIRKRFIDLDEKTMRLGPNKELLIDSENKEIGLVYFRYCYDPSNYKTEKDWNNRLLMERSRAIKCPSINFHISGAKKFQQTLNNQEQLEKFLSSKDSERLSKVFCKIWSLDDENFSTNKFFESNLVKNLVLKPQREGGGHNIFGSDIIPFLEKLKSKDLAQYILMEYINSPKEKNWLLLHDDELGDKSTKLDNCDQLISELGIFGSIIGERNIGIMSNKSAGYLVRSKKYGVNEGGVAAGYAGISSLILYDGSRDDLDPLLYYDHQ